MTTPPPEPPTEGPAASDPPPAAASPYGAPPPAYEQAPAPGYSSAPPPYPAAAPGAPVPGGLLDRFLARLIDSILVGIVNFLVASVIIAGAIMGSSATGFGTGSSYAAGAVVAIIGTAISLGYFALMEHTRGQTVGKMILKLQTIGPAGGNPTLEEAVKRNSYILLGLLGLIPAHRLDRQPGQPGRDHHDRRDHQQRHRQPAGLARQLRRRHAGAQDRLTPGASAQQQRDHGRRCPPPRSPRAARRRAAAVRRWHPAGRRRRTRSRSAPPPASRCRRPR